MKRLFPPFPGAFIAVFLFLMIAVGLPVHVLEVSLGQFTGFGISSFCHIAPIFSGIVSKLMIIDKMHDNDNSVRVPFQFG